MTSPDYQEQLFEFRLDNAAKIFPAIHNKRQSTIFRVSASIDRPVNIHILDQALKAMLVRCPYYKVHLRRGLFWYYLESSDTEPRVEAESRYPCLYIPYKKPGILPFRIIAYRNRISFEVAHFITDGTGALWFLNGLLLEYLRRRGETIEHEGTLIDCRDPVDPAEFEDSFSKHYERGVPPAKQIPPALQLRGKAEPPPVFHVTEGSMDSGELKREASRYGATIGEFITALQIDVSREMMEGRKLKPKPIRISVPIDLRRFFSSRTLRNFALAVEPGIDPRLGNFTFEDIVGKVHHFMKMELDHKMIRRQFTRNIEGERNPFIRITPLFLKDRMLKYFYNIFGRRVFTISFSNLGRISTPSDLQKFVTGYDFLPPPLEASIGTTAIAYKGCTHIFITSTIRDRDFERRFFTRLRQMDIHVSIKTNRR
jgi:hypothetical protein